MTEFHIIGLGNLCEFVIKDIDNSRTYGVFSACSKHARESMQGFIDYVNEIIEENQVLKQSDHITDLETQILKLKEENEKLKKALWEAESDYIHERYEYSFEIEQELDDLKKEFERGYWND